MPQRYDIVKIDFQANARGANAAIESMRVETERCQATVDKLRKDLKEKINMNLPADQIETARKQLKAAEKQLKQMRTGYRELIKGMRTLDEGIKAFNDGTLSSMPAEFQKKVMNAANKVKGRLHQDSNSYKKDTQELTALIDAADQNYKRIQTDAQQVVNTISKGGKVSRAVVEEELKQQRDLLNVLAETDKGYDQTAKRVAVLDHYLKAMGGSYEYIRKNISDTKKVSDETLRNMFNELQQTNNEGKVTQRIMRENSKVMREIRKEQTRRVESVLGGDLTKQSEASIRVAIANAKELIQVYGTGSKRARDLSVEIVNAEEYLKTVGVEAARSARQQADAAKQADDKLKLMQGRMANLRTLTQSALTETQKFWQAQLEGSTKGSKAYKEAERNLKSISAELERNNKQQLRDNANRLGRRDLSTLSEKELQEAVAAAKQLAQSMQPASLEYKVLVSDINRGEEALKKFGLQGQQSMQIMTDRMKSLGSLSNATLEETRKFWQSQMDGASRGSKAYKTASDNLDAIVKKQQELALAQNKASADSLLTASTSKQGFTGMSENELRNGINAAREYQKSLAADSNEYKNLSIAIAKADEYIKLYGVDAEKAKMKEAELKTAMRDRVSSLQKLQQASTSGLAEAQKYWQAQMDGAEKGTSDFLEAEAALKKVNEQISVRANAKSQRVLGTPDKYGDAEVRDAIKAMEQLRDAQAHSSVEWNKYNSLVEKGRKYLEDWANADAVDKYEQKMQNLSTISDAALADMRKFWETTIANTEQGSTDLQKYEDYLKKVVAVENDRRDYKNLGEVDLLKNSDLGKFSESEIRRAIEAGKQLIQTYETGSQDAKDLAKNIVNAEKHLEQYGISAEKSAQREAEAVKKANDERAQHDQLMQDQLKQGTSLSESALKAQESYWQRLIDDPKTASASLQQYQANLLKVDMIQKQMVADYGNNALKFFQGDTSYASAEEIKQNADALKKWRDTIPAQTEADTIQQIDTILGQLGQSAKEAAGQVMSLQQALQIGQDAATPGNFKGTADKLKAAKKTLEDTLAVTDKYSDRYNQIRDALQGIALEEQRVGERSAKVNEILDHPKGKSFIELKLAVEEGRKALNGMDRTTKEGQQAFDDLSKKIKACDLEMKNLAGDSKGTASAFEKAWDRFKTYVTFYVGASEAFRKVGSSVDDLMELSDKMGELRKTTGFTADQVGMLSDNLTKLDTRTPLSKLMDLSAAAGQLGLTTQDDIQGFTEAANEMLVALPEMGTEGATEMMKIAIATGEVNKIQKQMQDGTVQGSSATAVAMEKIGSTIDRLRATTAAAAPPIADFVKRVGAVGAQSGISVDQVAGLGATVDALGMGTEMAATAISRMIPAIKNNAFDIAKAIGVTPETLRNLFSAGNGMEAVLLVLQKMHEQDMGPDSIEKFLGENGMTGIMKDLNQQGARAGIVFAGLSQNVDVLRQNLATANEAYQEGSAITSEYEKMNETAAAKWERLKNEVEEFFVSARNSEFLGTCIDILRGLVNFITGNVGPALRLVSGLVKVLITYISVLKIGLGEAIFIKAAGGISTMSGQLKNLIANTKSFVKYNYLLVKAQNDQARAAIRARMANEGLNKTMLANVWMAVVAAVVALGVVMYHWIDSLKEEGREAAKFQSELDQEMAKVDKLTDSIGQARVKTEEANKEVENARRQLDAAKRATDGSTESTNRLKKAEEDLLVAEEKKRIAMAAQKRLIQEFNTQYSKYLGFMLSEVSSNYELANARQLVNDKLRETLTLKRQEAAIQRVETKYGGDRDEAYGDLYDAVKSLHGKKVGFGVKIDATTAARIMNGLATAANSSKDRFDFIGKVNSIFNSNGVNIDQNIYDKAEDYFNEVQKVREETAKVQQQFSAENSVNRTSTQNTLLRQLNAGFRNYNALLKKYKNSNGSARAENAAAVLQEMDTLNELKDNAASFFDMNDPDEAARYRKKLGRLNYWHGYNRKELLTAAGNRYTPRQTVTNNGNGYSGSGGFTPSGNYTTGNTDNNPWGAPQSAVSTDWSKMSADALVDRRKQMNNFVKAIQSDSDISSVLKEDPALQNAIKKGLSKDMDSVIGWYNTQRLKIQDELHKRFLTNTGNWKDPNNKHTRNQAAKMVKDDISYYMDELDAFYTERKTRIEEAHGNGEITEAESQRRTYQNEQEWYQRRGELQMLYSKNAGKVTKAEADVIYNILSDRTGESVKLVKGNIGNTIKFISDVGKKSAAAERRIQGDLDKGAEQSFSKSQAAVAKQMEAIAEIISKERPFDGIVKNLNDNITKMGLLQPDFEKRRKALHDALVKDDSDEMKALNAEGAKEIPSRLTFLLQEAEDAYSVTWDKLEADMRKDGRFGSWIDAILADDGHADERKQALLAQLRTLYDSVQDAIKKEASQVKKLVEIQWNDTTKLPNGMSMKQTYENAINALGIESDRTSRANSLINAGPRSERVGDKLAIKQMQIQLDMQQHYYNLMQKIGLQRVENLKLQAREAKAQGDINKATQLELDAKHAQVSLDLSRTEETLDLAKLQADIDAKVQESNNRLYTHLKEWGELLSSSMQSMFEASNSGVGDYYDNLAKMRLTGEGAGGGTYVVIENSGTEKASAHYENLDGEDALKRQLEIQQQNATADAWRKVMDDINKKINDEITDLLNSQLQEQAINANTDAVVANTAAIYASMGESSAESSGAKEVAPQSASTGGGLSDPSIERIGFDEGKTDKMGARAARKRAGLPVDEAPYDNTGYGAEQAEGVGVLPFLQAMDGDMSFYDLYAAQGDAVENFAERQVASIDKVKAALDDQFHKQELGSKKANKTMVSDSHSAFAKMAQAANLYGAAYQAMTNDNLSSSQKFQMIALQAAGQTTMALMTASFVDSQTNTLTALPEILAKCLKINPLAGAAIFAVLSALIGASLGVAMSKLSKGKSQIAQITGASASAGRLSTGMLTYAEGNVNEFTDPSSLTPGKSYNVDAADGRTYRAKYTGKNPTTHITNGPEFHLAGERGREAIIDAHTTRLLQMDDTGIWQSIQTLYNGGSLQSVRRRGKGMKSFAAGNLDDFGDAISASGVGEEATGGTTLTPDAAAAMQQSLDRNNELLQRALDEGIHAKFDVYGKGGLIDSYDTGKKTVNRHGERY